VARIASDVSGKEPTIDRDPQRVFVAVGDPSALRTASRELDEAGITVHELALRRPSLDEVFLSLTGHPAEDGQQGQGAREGPLDLARDGTTERSQP